MEIFTCWLKLEILGTLVLENALMQVGEGIVDKVLGYSARAKYGCIVIFLMLKC
ncbi:hypothetical protein KSP40_PGU001064 [Platanthera guangdongensis]|uniref:Uncharacterized protein n=1 Tax=Platanthera guangdongensis TaxID=2320717 RepID=A0ABR2MHN5_9ASPA